jgi:hypothetical protein
MTISSEDDLSRDIRPVCPNDNSVMLYQGTYLMMRDPIRPSIVER